MTTEALEPGTRLDRYTVEALIGEGAMGKVYRAFDTRLERPVAIKVLAPLGGGGDAIASALREARAAAAILHPNATSVFDADRVGDTTFIVMELVRGTSLRQLVGDASVPLDTRVRWLVDVGGALGAAHRAGVVHRDVKPENVIVREDGLVKVLDFGIARLPHGGAETVATAGDRRGSGHVSSAGTLVGTPAYMAPEQIRGDEVDGRADQFGWGVLAYELLAGVLPWGDAGDPIAQLTAVLSAAPAELPAEAAVPAELAAAVHRALAKAPEDRFPSMTEAVAAIAPFAGARRRLLSGDYEVGAEPPASAPGSSPEVPFSQRIAPSARSVAPPPFARRPPPSPRPPRAPPAALAPGMRPLAGGPAVVGALAAELQPEPVPGLRPPDFSAPVDLDAHLALLPPDATCKGIFFLDLLRLGARAMPPARLFHLAGFPERRYVVFRDYPLSENLRLTVAVALALYPTLPLGEGLRRIGQTAFDAVSASLVGKTLFGVLGRELEPLLLTAPRAYRLFLHCGDVTVEKVGPGRFLFRARGFPGFLETYQVGVVEGVLRHCGARGQLRVALEALDRVTMELQLG